MYLKKTVKSQFFHSRLIYFSGANMLLSSLDVIVLLFAKFANNFRLTLSKTNNILELTLVWPSYGFDEISSNLILYLFKIELLTLCTNYIVVVVMYTLLKLEMYYTKREVCNYKMYTFTIICVLRFTVNRSGLFDRHQVTFSIGLLRVWRLKGLRGTI